MPADPVPGLSYRQEYLQGEAEDRGEIVTVGEEIVGTPAGSWDDVLMTRDLVPTEPGVQELKFYARGVGPVLSTAHGRGRARGARLLPRGPGQLRRRAGRPGGCSPPGLQPQFFAAFSAAFASASAASAASDSADLLFAARSS